MVVVDNHHILASEHSVVLLVLGFLEDNLMDLGHVCHNLIPVVDSPIWMLVLVQLDPILMLALHHLDSPI